MTVTVISRYPDLERFRTGFFTFDWAVGDPSRKSLGLMLNTPVHIYGSWSSGKTSIALFLASLPLKKGKVLMADFERSLDYEYARQTLGRAGFNGELEIISHMNPEKPKEARSDAEQLEELISRIRTEPDISGVLLDSVGAFDAPDEEKEDQSLTKGYAEAHNAMVLARFMKQLSRALRTRKQPCTAFIVNHSLPIMGAKGHRTPGGAKINFLSRTAIYLYHKESFSDKKTGQLFGSLMATKVEKLTYGGKGREGLMFMIPGFGVSKEMTAIFDCFVLGLAERGNTVMINGKSLGYISKLLDAATKGKYEVFEPFFEQLKYYEDENVLSDISNIEGEETPMPVAKTAPKKKGGKHAKKV